MDNSQAKKESADVDHVFSETLFSFVKLCGGFTYLNLSYTVG